MNYKEAIIKVFEGKKPSVIPWQPRIYYWYNANITRKTIPERFKDKSMMEVYKELKISPRYISEVLNLNPIRMNFNKVEVKMNMEEDNIITILSTPLGELREVKKMNTEGGHRIVEFFCKKIEHLKIIEYVIKNLSFHFDEDIYNQGLETFENWGVPQIYPPRRSPLQMLFLDFMGIEETIYALYDEKKKVEEFMKVCEETDEKLYEVLITSPLKIINFGENLDSQIISPSLFEKYLLPYYNKRCHKLHKAGKFCHIHIDGRLKGFLPYLSHLDFDGYEALTPAPQGDVELEEIKSAIGNKVLIDGIPAIMFLDEYSEEELLEFTNKVIKLFYPHLILGVSDELPPDAKIERVEMIGDYLFKDAVIDQFS